jgi:predicted amidohydrolase YtcJ
MLQVLSLSPDAVFLNASGMITMADPIQLDWELTALAVKDGRIIAMGPDAEITRMAEDAEVVDLQPWWCPWRLSSCAMPLRR